MTPERKPINVAVIGAGAFGRNHARIYHQLQKESGQIRLVAIADLDPARAASLAQEYAKSGTRAFGSVKELTKSGHVQAASVTVPTVEHLKVAGELMEAGIDVLIEKPLAATLADAVVGEPARGSYTKSSDGKLNVTKVRFGKKPGGGKGGGKKSKDAASQPKDK